MQLAKFVGNEVSTSKDERLVGFKLLLIRKIDENENYIGELEIAVDTVGAGAGEVVIVVRSGGARHAAGREQAPLDAAIVGIVDTVEMEM